MAKSAREEQPEEAAADMEKFVLRLPRGMRDEIREWAAGNKRSMNAEIIARLDAYRWVTDNANQWLHTELRRTQQERFDALRRLREVTSNESGRNPEIVVGRLLAAMSLPTDAAERQAAEWEAMAYLSFFPLPDVDRIEREMTIIDVLGEKRAEELANKMLAALDGPLNRVAQYLRHLGWAVAKPTGDAKDGEESLQ